METLTDSTRTGIMRPRNLPHPYPSQSRCHAYLFRHDTRIALNPEQHDSRHSLTTNLPTHGR